MTTKRTDEPKLHVELYYAFSFYDYACFEHAWQMLQQPVVPRGLRYGRTQPCKHAISSDTRVAFDLFAYDNALLFGTPDQKLKGLGSRRVGCSIPMFPMSPPKPGVT